MGKYVLGGLLAGSLLAGYNPEAWPLVALVIGVWAIVWLFSGPRETAILQAIDEAETPAGRVAETGKGCTEMFLIGLVATAICILGLLSLAPAP